MGFLKTALSNQIRKDVRTVKCILVVTHRRGFEADPVMDALRKRGIGVFRFNCDAGEDASRASFVSERDETEFLCDGRRIKGGDIAVGWCQQLPPYIGQAADERECLQRQNLLALQCAIFNHLPIPWLNKPCHVVRASNKVSQLIAAKTVGLPVLETLVSNDPRAIREFAQKRVVVAKNLDTPWIVSSGQTRAAYTRIIEPEWLTNDSALSFAPVIYQEYRERKRDFRVVVVADRFFAAACVPAPHQREDVREGCGTGDSFTACDFDADLLHKLRALMCAFSLDYCAADFIEDEHGNVFFLEVNTCGAWWWLDRLYDGVICGTIADALERAMGG